MVYNPPMAGTKRRPTLKAGKPIETPPSARDMYRRSTYLRPANWPCAVEWSEDLEESIARTYKELRYGDGKKYLGFQHTRKPDKVWNDAEYVKVGDRWKLKGNCNAFCPTLLERLKRLQIPRGAMSLTNGYYGREGHMVLTIRTDKGVMVCCNITGCSWLGDDNLRHHRLTFMERGPGWCEIKQKVSLDQIFGKEAAE